MTSFPQNDRDNTVSRYTQRFEQYGVSPLTLGWNKGRQPIRFASLTSQYKFANRSILDIGCGFGDLISHLNEKQEVVGQYTGIDLVPALIEAASAQWTEPKYTFICDDFLSCDLPTNLDFAVASGVFNHKLDGIDNYEFIEASIARAFEACRDGLAFDFLSDLVDYEHEHTFHSSPTKILEMALRHTRNVVLRNDYMPFEFSLFMFKNDSFKPEVGVFERFLESSSYTPTQL